MRRALVLFNCLLLLILNACATSSMSWSKEKSEYGNLPNHVGDISKLHEQPFDLSGGFNEGLAEKTEYDDRTNKWLDTDFSLSAGKQLPGDEVYIQLRNKPENLKLRYQLTERDAELNNIGLIKEEVTSNLTFKTSIPEKEGALYLLSVEVLDNHNQVEDTLLSLVEVPIQSMNAKLFTDDDTYEPNDTVTLKLENFGPTNLFFGTPYYIEQYENHNWQRYYFEGMGFDDIGLILKPGKTYEQSFDLPDLPNGKYRVVKKISGDGTELEETLAAEFNVGN